MALGGKRSQNNTSLILIVEKLFAWNGWMDEWMEKKRRKGLDDHFRLCFLSVN